MAQYTFDTTGTSLLNVGGQTLGDDGLQLQFTVTGTNSIVLKKLTSPPGAAQSFTNVAWVNESNVLQSAGTAITASGLARISSADAANDIYLTLTATSGSVVVLTGPWNAGNSGGGGGGNVPAADVTAGTFGANSGETGAYGAPGDLTVGGQLTTTGTALLAQSTTTATSATGTGTGSSSTSHVIRAASGQTSSLVWRVGASSTGNRFAARTSGSDGATWELEALDDTGVDRDAIFTVQRAANGAIYTPAGRSITFGGAPAAAATVTRNRIATTAIANNVATTVATITIPNAAHSACIRFTVVGSLGAGGAIGANEASASNSYVVTVTRTAGVNAVAEISSAFGAAASAVAGAATVTAALTLAAVSGAVGATNTVAVQVTIARSGGSSDNHTAVTTWEIVNANSSGISVA